MTNTTNYNLILAEGTDLVNYLTQTNPNFSNLDTIIKGISDATVTTATEVASGTAHAITRTLPDANVIRFTATSNWVLGDTMTIDGTPVTVVKPNGTNLQSGDYVIGAEVLGVIRATQFTVYVGGSSSLDAVDVDYDNTVSGLTATDVQAAIDEEAAAINTINSNLAELEKNDLSATIDISNYTSSNMYTCPSDGYLIANANSSGSVSSVAIVGSGGDPNNRVLLEASYATGRTIVPVFIKKGMMLYKNSGTGTYGMNFKPLV